MLSTKFTDSVGYEVTNENVWMAASRVVVTGQRVDRFGANILLNAVTDGDQIDGKILASEIVNDLIGRCLRGIIDPTLCDVRNDTWRLTQADYREPTTPGEVMDDMLLPHPDHLWRVGRRSLSSGLAPLTWDLWDTTARYVIDSDVQVDLDGSPDPLCNSVTVRWVDWKGRPRSDTFTADPLVYPDIADLQGIREADVIDLDASLGEWDVVQRIGLQMLDQVARRTVAGTITVTRPVLDVQLQQRVPPCQIEAGSTLVLASDEPSIVHRVHTVTHPSVEVAEISIGRPRLTLDQIVAARGRRRR